MLAACVGCAGLVSSARAGAEDLRDVAGRVEGAWRDAGGVVARRDTRFVMEDETTTIDLRADLGHGRAARAFDADCLRVALIGARGMSFHVNAVSGADEDAAPVASAAGVIELHGCGLVPDVVRLRSDSGRGALEIVVASSKTALPPVSAILLERTGGALPAAPEPGPLPPLPSPRARALVAEARLRAEGFTLTPETVWPAGDDGKGSGERVLDPGCHHFELFAAEPHARGVRAEVPRRSRLDLDGALRRADGDHDLIAEDQTIAPDVRLDACVAASTKVRVTFEGAPRGSPVLVTQATHPLPLHLPGAWAPEVRARLASALFAHRVASPTDDAILLARGASGNTPVPLPLEPGACYVAIAAMERAGARGHGIALRATVADRVAQDDQGAREDAAIVAFCARDATFARLEVDARSAASGWSLAVFRMVGGAWGVAP